MAELLALLFIAVATLWIIKVETRTAQAGLLLSWAVLILIAIGEPLYQLLARAG